MSKVSSVTVDGLEVFQNEKYNLIGDAVRKLREANPEVLKGGFNLVLSVEPVESVFRKELPISMLKTVSKERSREYLKKYAEILGEPVACVHSNERCDSCIEEERKAQREYDSSNEPKTVGNSATDNLKKAYLCVEIARLILPKDVSEKELEDKAVRLMFSSEADLLAMKARHV